VSEAAEALRRYLRQRREMGERELVLDGLRAEEMAALLAAEPRPRPLERLAPSEALAGATAPGATTEEVVHNASLEEL
jgi:hypothetical protein